jgi:hypothetical protein
LTLIVATQTLHHPKASRQPSMSSNAIIEGLKQGNAIELGVLKDMKEGFVKVVDGMINECLNRSDGLSELMEKLQIVRSSISKLAT